MDDSELERRTDCNTSDDRLLVKVKSTGVRSGKQNKRLIHIFEDLIGLLPAYRLFKIYWAFHGLKWTAAGAKQELTCTTTFGKPNSPPFTGYGMAETLTADVETLNQPDDNPGIQDSGRSYWGLQSLIESRQMHTWNNNEAGAPVKEAAHFHTMCMNIFHYILAKANVVVAACYSAAVDDPCHKFESTMVVVDDCNLASNLETCIPSIIYEDVRIRASLGIRKHCQSWLAIRMICTLSASFLELMLQPEVPVHELKVEYLEQNAWDDEEDQYGDPTEKDGELGLAMGDTEETGEKTCARNKPYSCASEKKYK